MGRKPNEFISSLTEEEKKERILKMARLRQRKFYEKNKEKVNKKNLNHYYNNLEKRKMYNKYYYYKKKDRLSDFIKKFGEPEKYGINIK